MRLLTPIDRRYALRAACAFTALACSPGISGLARAAQRGLLDPAAVENFSPPEIQTAVIDGGAGKVTFTRDGPADGPLVLYFHGWGDDYRMVMPLEYGLVEA